MVNRIIKSIERVKARHKIVCGNEYVRQGYENACDNILILSVITVKIKVIFNVRLVRFRFIVRCLISWAANYRPCGERWYKRPFKNGEKRK